MKPNCLWISLEDTSPRFGCYGDPVARTPNLDKLASEGRRYTNAFSTAGVCAPSRSAIITGVYQTSMGTHHMRTTHTNPNAPELPTPYSAVPPHYVKTFTEYLRAAGYFCTNNSKTDYQFTPPFTAWDELGSHGHWRNREQDDQPFFAVFNPTLTHESGMWEEEFRRADAAYRGIGRTETLETNPDDVELPPYLPDNERCRTALARHYDNLAQSDRIVGDILAELEADGLADNTVVFIWSDHGEGLPRGKRWPYDRGINIPLIVRWPGQIDAGEVTDQLVSMVDLGPTLLSLADVPIPTHMQGQPFLGDHAVEREYIYAARDRHDEAYDMVRAVRDKRFKYLRNFCPEKPYLLWIPYRNRHPILQDMWRLHREDKLEGPQKIMMQSTRPPEELYDTESDPWEINNLADDPAHQETLNRMRLEMYAWREDVGDAGEITEDQMVDNRWPNKEQPTTGVPTFVPIAPEVIGEEAAPDGGSYASPMLLQMHVGTQGASIGYTLEEGDDAHWKLYSGPLALPEGTHTIRAKAIRIGYGESEERVATFTVS
ncbi:MAG: sulfatase [Gemmatimonadetes bacterium]|nr:sulfatase [Gemmatimonadota bacterium]